MSRLSKQDWIDAGFEALVENGPDALKAEPLARRLGTTKGSFYWHFKDVPAFKSELISTWEAAAVANVLGDSSEDQPAALKLRALSETMTGDAQPYANAGLENAMRSWANGDAELATSVQRLDAKRIAALGAVLNELGVSNPDFPQLIHAAFIGLEDLASRNDDLNLRPLASLIDLVIALGRDD